MTVTEQGGIDLIALADVLKRKGHVRGEPVAISLFHTEIPSGFSGRRVEPCAIVHHAMDLGETVYVDAEFQNCLAGAWQAGFIDPPEEIKTGRYLADGIPGFEPDAAREVKTGLNVLPQGMLRGIGAAPLIAVPDGVHIDSVVVVCEPVYAATIGGARTVIDGTPPRGAAGTSLCGELFALPYHEENVIITPGDMGGRMFNKIKPSEMFVIIPLRYATHIERLLAGTPDVPALMESIKPGYAADRTERLRERAARQGTTPIHWDDDARALLERAPEAVREFAEPTLIEYAQANGHERITIAVIHEQMESVGMRLNDVLGDASGDEPAAADDPPAPADIDRGAPVIASTDLQINASPARVWNVIANISTWSEVYPELHDVAFDGPLEPGAPIAFRAGPARLSGRIEAVSEGALLAFSGKGKGAAATYRFRVDPTATGARLRIDQSMSGMAVRAVKAMLQRVADASVRDWAAGIAKEAEGRR